MGWFKKRKTPPNEKPELTFKTRVEKFWDWYRDVAPRFYETIEAGRCADLGSEISEKVNELLPGLAWVFGPGKDKIGHSLTISAEGVASKYPLTDYWRDRAPELKGWTFYESRQPGEIQGSIRIGDNSYDAAALWVSPAIDGEEQKIHLTAWHPLFESLDNGQQMMVLFLWLDETLGERGTSRWIGEIKVSDQELKEAMPLSELRDLTTSLLEEQEWHASEEIGIVYQLEPVEGPLRADTYVGSTSVTQIVNHYFESFAPHPENPLDDLGADYHFLSIDGRDIPEEDPLTFRNEIENSLESALESEKSGLVVGGALGITNAYIDLLLFDGEASIELVKKVIQSANLQHPVGLHPFYQSTCETRLL